MMASKEKVVRISYQELEHLASNQHAKNPKVHGNEPDEPTQDQGKKQRNRQKRPDIAIYQPRMRFQKKEQEEDNTKIGNDNIKQHEKEASEHEIKKNTDKQTDRQSYSDREGYFSKDCDNSTSKQGRGTKTQDGVSRSTSDSARAGKRDEGTHNESNDTTSVSNIKKKQKRPPLQVYVPKPKLIAGEKNLDEQTNSTGLEETPMDKNQSPKEFSQTLVFENSSFKKNTSRKENFDKKTLHQPHKSKDDNENVFRSGSDSEEASVERKVDTSGINLTITVANVASPESPSKNRRYSANKRRPRATSNNSDNSSVDKDSFEDPLSSSKEWDSEIEREIGRMKVTVEDNDTEVYLSNSQTEREMVKLKEDLKHKRDNRERKKNKPDRREHSHHHEQSENVANNNGARRKTVSNDESQFKTDASNNRLKKQGKKYNENVEGSRTQKDWGSLVDEAEDEENEEMQSKKNKHRGHVTFTNDEPQVKVIERNKRSPVRQRQPHPQHQHQNRHGRLRQDSQSSTSSWDEDESNPARTARGGGIIHLPFPGSQPQASEPNYPHPQQRGYIHNRGRGGGRGRGQRQLFDPKNPNKPIVIEQSQPQLHFHDPNEPYSPEPPRGGYGDIRQVQYPEGYPREVGFPYPPYPPMAYFDSGTYHDDTYSRDPYYHSGYEQEMMLSGRSRSANRMAAEQMLSQAIPLDGQLGNILSRRLNAEGVERMNQMRRELQRLYEQVILLDPDLSNRHNVEQNLWKAVYYHAIEMFRKLLQEEDQDGRVKQNLMDVLEEGLNFYNDLLQKLQTTFNFNLSIFLDSSHLPPENLSRHVKLALLSAQRCMIFLGDIHRYKEQSNDAHNFGRARSWYMKAQHLAPKNGRPYNQLAILALYTRRKLDAVYYYMRSLAASNPFLTARESLMSLFDEARKKAEVTEKKKQAEKERLQRKRQRERLHNQEEGHRVEIWIAPDGTSSEDMIDDEADNLHQLSAIELNKRFSLSFLICHGKLFTKIGMETFPEAASQMLQEFEVLLQHSPVPVGDSRLLQLIVINMFAVDSTSLKSTTVENECRSLLQEQAIQLGLDMFGLLLERCVQLYRDHLSESTSPEDLMNEDLHHLLPSVKVWSDWMVCHSALWNPPPNQKDPTLGPEIDVWQSLAELCNILNNLDISHISLYREKMEDLEPVILEEDVMLAGFVPLLSLPDDRAYVHKDEDRESAKDCCRIEKLKLFGEYLCGIEPPMLMYDVQTKKYKSVAPKLICENKQDKEQENLSEDDDVIVESEEEEEVCSDDEEHVKQLKQKKSELKKKMEQQQKQEENIQAIFEKESRSIELEVRPLFLIPDTNCFIDHLKTIKTILEGKKYTIVVPLVVMNELDGLSKGDKSSAFESVDHAGSLESCAKGAVAYLEEEFENRNSHLKALTSKGTVMETISYRSEETSHIGNNDDLILSCCLHYCQDKARDFMPRERNTPVRLYREVVLLTDDRNLRLKAHTRNVPVKDVVSFAKWARIT